VPTVDPYTEADILDWEKRLSDAVVHALHLVCNEAADQIGQIVVAADGPPGQPYVSVDDLASMPGLWTGQVQNLIMPLVGEIYQDAAGKTHAKMVDLVGPQVPSIGSQVAEDYLAGAANRWEFIGGDVWENARAELLDGFQRGESIPKLAARVRGAANISQRRATALARTEVVSASNAGSFASAQSSELDMTKQWLATEDERTRPTHRTADGQSRPLNEPFTVGVASLMYPGDPTGPAEETNNCRCTIVYDIPKATVKAARKKAPATPGQPPQAAAITPGVKSIDTRTGAHDGLTDEEYDVLRRYAGGDFGPLNKAHRAGTELTGRLAADTASIDGILASSRTAESVEVFRGLRTGRGIFGPRETWPDDFTGFEWDELAYESTSLFESSALDFAAGPIGGQPGILLRMSVPQGTGAVEIHALDEFELLLQRGLHHRVIGESTTTRQGRVVRVLHVDVTPGEPLRDRPTNLGALVDREIEAGEVDIADWEPIFQGTFANLDTVLERVALISDEGQPALRVRGTIQTVEGQTVGDFTRQYGRDPDTGILWAEHVSLEIKPSYRAAGFSEQFNARLFDAYRAAGVQQVRLSTADVGGYAWARAGYDWASSYTADGIKERLKAAVRALRDRNPNPEGHHWGPVVSGWVDNAQLLAQPDEDLDAQIDQAQDLIDRWESLPFGSREYPTPYEVSQLGRHQGQRGAAAMWLGKYAMLKSNWNGVRRL